MVLQRCRIPLDDCVEAGIDECGRGCLAGPVVAAAVIWSDEIEDDTPEYQMINDSKKLTPKRRAILSDYIKENALDWSIAFVDRNVIDEINILNANMQAMRKAVDGLDIRPESLLIDGNVWRGYKDPESGKELEYHLVEKGDSIYQSIACASIIAKVARDDYMAELGQKYPEYGWASNKGYGSLGHRQAIEKHGITPYHRLSFEPCKSLVLRQRLNEN